MGTQIGRRKGVVLEDVAVGFIWLDFWRMKLLCSLHCVI